jgi:exodeoxyribonuclease VII large subunit
MNQKMSLSELQQLIRDALYLSLPQMFWVTAEISEITVNNAGHCYLELIEKQHDEKNVRAKVRGIIWSSRYGIVKSFFENITGEALRPGIKILVRAKVEYHELYGLSLVINDIDPAFTLGEMALKRQQIIKKLEDEGVFTMNRELPFPLLPQRIAVISSGAAAGYTDFINHLTGNSYGYVFYTVLIDTPMQGIETEQGVVNSLDRIARDIDKFDLVVIIRGGGSQTDLSWFDSYVIAYHITQFPIPVVTGIGHEKNLSVTDLVANRSLKTPTAVADFLVDCMMSAEASLTELSTSIRDLTRQIIDQNRAELEAYRIKLQPASRILLAENREWLSGKILELMTNWRRESFRSGLLTSGFTVRIKSAAVKILSDNMRSIDSSTRTLLADTRNVLSLAESKLANHDRNLRILDPANVLHRGYTITSAKGKIVRSSQQIHSGDEIETWFSDGKADSIVRKVN